MTEYKNVIPTDPAFYNRQGSGGIPDDCWRSLGFARDDRLRHIPAFGLAELTVSVGIFAMVTGLLLANFRQGERNDSVRAAVRQVASMMHKAQNAAMSGVVISGKNCAAVQGCGFGVYLKNAGAPVSFWDINANQWYDIGEEVWGGAQNLAGGVALTTLSSAASSAVLFIPPSGRTIIFERAGGSAVPTAAWTFSRTGATSKTLEVNSATGRISY